MDISRVICGCVVAVGGTMSALWGEEVQMQAQRVSLFKNGYACVQMQGTLPQGRVVDVKGLPLPLFGTLGWRVPEGVQVARFEGRMSEEQCVDSSPAAALRSLAGKEVCVMTTNKREYRGVLVVPAPTMPLPQGAFCTEEESPGVQGFAPLVALRTARGGLVTLPIDAVAGVELADAVDLPAPRPAAAELRVELEAPAAGSPLQVDMVARGVSWLPTYRLELQEEGSARLVGNVTVINRLLDMEDVELELITGHPALGEGLVTSPLVRLVGLSAFLSALERNRDWVDDARRGNRSWARMSHAAPVRRKASGFGLGALSADDCDEDCDEAVAESAPVPMGAVTGGMGGGTTTRAEEFTYYTIPSFSCKRGEVVESELFDIAVPCRHVYTCDLPDQRVLQAAERSERSVTDVWHCVRLTNNGKLPWSMGVVSCHRGGRFAARSSLPFTAVGQESLLRLSKSLETSITCREELVENGSRRPDGRRTPDVYRGRIVLTNLSEQPIELELTKAVFGTPTEASDAGQTSVTPVYSGNPRAVVSWKLRLEPRQEKTCTYIYQYLND